MPTPAETIEKQFRSWYWDPVAFCHDVFPENERPREWQPEALAAIKKNPWLAIVACRKAGKTRLAAYLALWFLCTRANSLVLTIAPVWSQVIQAIWTDIRHLWSVSKLPLIFPGWTVLTHEIQTLPGTPKWRAIGLASDKVENLEGRHPAAGQPALVIVDESKGVANEFFNSLQGMLSEAGSLLVAIGTPGIPYGWLYDAFTKNRSSWWTKKIRADQIPRLAAKCQAEVDRLGIDDPFLLQQWFAEFSGGGEGAIIPLSLVQKAINKPFKLDATFRKVASLDVAAGGKDHTVLSRLHGPVLLRQTGWQGWDIVRSEHKVLEDVREWRPEMLIVDQSGVGEGVVSHLRHQLKGSGTTVIGWRSGSRPRERERFENLKAEEIFRFRDRLKEGSVSIPDHPDLIGQLCSWTADISKSHKTIVVDPEDSPDFADSCIMGFAADRLGQSVKGITPEFLQ